MHDMLDEYVKSLIPLPVDRTTVAERKRSILEALKSWEPNPLVYESGSFAHGTGIKSRSDVDVMAWTSVARPVYPSSALARMRDTLYWAGGVYRTSVASPTVKVEFYSDPVFEVVPAWYHSETKAGDLVFLIPGRYDEWVLSSPGAHNSYVNSQNDRLYKRVKGLVRLLKAWKYEHGVPVSSFYLEMRAASFASGESYILYLTDVKAVLAELVGIEFRSMQDPEHIVGLIPACSSEVNRLASLAAARRAIADLSLALDAYYDDDSVTYWSRMADVFGSGFPWPT